LDRAVKLAAICYHRHAYERYPVQWLEEYSDSIQNQSVEVDLFEMNYGAGNARILAGSSFLSANLPTHVHAQNYLLDLVFSLGYDGVLNTNVDDVYSTEYAAVSRRSLEAGAQLASSNFLLTNHRGVEYHRHRFEGVDIAGELRAGNNVISHPTTVYSRAFWEGCSRYDPDEIPHEDLSLWQREVGRFRFVIAPEYLVAHRVHSRSVCAEEAAKEEVR
jgi:hypothetical protein